MKDGVIGLLKFVDSLLLTLFDISLIGFGGTLSVLFIAGSRLFDVQGLATSRTGRHRPRRIVNNNTFFVYVSLFVVSLK
ncbi:hypothetical protein DYY65_11460 [Nitrososphaera sp. AFS]|nr:hypothetical protein [Nitrososphaera sp. AFS]